MWISPCTSLRNWCYWSTCPCPLHLHNLHSGRQRVPQYKCLLLVSQLETALKYFSIGLRLWDMPINPQDMPIDPRDMPIDPHPAALRGLHIRSYIHEAHSRVGESGLFFPPFQGSLYISVHFTISLFVFGAPNEVKDSSGNSLANNDMGWAGLHCVLKHRHNLII